MTLLIDATTAEHAGGIGTVINGILAEVPHVECGEVIVTAGPTLRPAEGLQVRRVALARTRPGRLFYQRLLLSLYASRLDSVGAVNRVLTLDSYAPLLRVPGGLHYAAVVHDTLPLTHPQFWPRAKRLTKRSAFSALRRASATIFTSTEYNAQEIKRLLGMTPSVARFGCGQLTDAEADAARIAPLPEPKPYLLYLGALEPRKDVLSLIEIFDLVASSLGGDLSLTIVGTGHPAHLRAIRARVATSPYRTRIALIEGASRGVTLDLLRHAAALVFPTLAEGFGLPIVEALAVGTPVVASDIESIRSWAGDAVLYAPPSRPGKWLEPVAAALVSDTSRRRSGQELASVYRWHRCATDLLTFV